MIIRVESEAFQVSALGIQIFLFYYNFEMFVIIIMLIAILGSEGDS